VDQTASGMGLAGRPILVETREACLIGPDGQLRMP
jgi:hypothetical protein